MAKFIRFSSGKILVIAGFLALGGCADLSPTEQRVLSGGSLGSAAGIGITVLTGGCIPCGGSIGSLLGSGAGYLYDQYMDSKPPES
jgi:hypothetical protein